MESATPWRFSLEFDEERSIRNGYDPDELYDCVGRIVEPRGNVRIGHGTWQAENRKTQFAAQIPTMMHLAQRDWLMENVASWIAWEDDPEGHDFLQILQETCPELIRS